MFNKELINKLKRLHHRLDGSTMEYDLDSYRRILKEIDALEAGMQARSDRELQQFSQTLMRKAADSVNPDELLVAAFALVREAICRVLRLRAFDEQIIGGIALHRGKLAEMQTGEGKTLTAVFPVYLNALSCKGVHVLTFNDYLARRDAEWMGPVYRFLGLSVGFVQEGMSCAERRQAYLCDIIYLTAREAGFDYLRDGLSYTPENIVQRPFHYALIDEADSILIDEARVPLVIAGSTDETATDLSRLARIARQLREGADVGFDEYRRNFNLTEKGLEHAERLLACENLYAEEHTELLTRLNCAIHAEHLLQRDVDYIVRSSKVELVDEFTGRVAEKRRWPDGLQAAVEAKEGLVIQSKGRILNSITLQHFLTLYPKISGMTATAQSAEEEFQRFYNLHTVVISPHKPCVRDDHPDRLFPTKAARLRALIREIREVHRSLRPILVGTRSVAESQQLAETLRKLGLDCAVLNAKQDEHEARIIADAGRPGAITISTNMAGRGVDIRLGGEDEAEREAVAKLGGLYVIGTNRHESRRIDRQLRGRSGRQGDPGSSRFFISLEDDLFVKYKLSELLPAHLQPKQSGDMIEHPILTREIDRIQRIIEGQNLEIKKTLCEYSALIEQQRRIVFGERQEILLGDVFADFCRSEAPQQYKAYVGKLGEAGLRDLCRVIGLCHLDRFWSQYLADIADIREGIHLMHLGRRVPIIEFRKMAIDLFETSREGMQTAMLTTFQEVEIRDGKADLDAAGVNAPSATWTYLVNDNPYEDNLTMQIAGDMALSIGAGICWPLLAVVGLINRYGRKRKKKREGERATL